MRRDILEIDASLSRTLYELQVTLNDVEALGLLLRGGSVVDWQRLAFEDIQSVDRFLSLHRLDLQDPVDCERLRYVFNEAVSYLEEQVHLHFPSDLRNPHDIRSVFLWASQTGGFRRRQILSCVILKLMHVIQHMEAADLKFRTALSEQYLFDLAEEHILRRARSLRELGIPIVAFYGSRKSRSSVITKLLSKKENLAATVFDKLRFRIVVETKQDLIAVLAHLMRDFFPFNYMIPGQTNNNLVDPAGLSELLPVEQRILVQPLAAPPSNPGTGRNEFSGSTYRSINFIVDYPVRIPEADAGGFRFELGRVMYVLVEFQIVDEETLHANEAGENAHHLYKRRQREVVARRLKRGRLFPRPAQDED